MQSTPSTVQPADLLQTLAKPSSAYKLRAWQAVAVLALFLGAYLGLAGWFLLTAYQLTVEGDTSSDRAWVGWLVGACAAFLAVFMLKGLFFVRAGGKAEGEQITAEQQPRLFEFLHALADKIGAPRPHKVYVTSRVNAAVFYELSPINLIWPSRKNLEIGLGLVNMLTLSEFRAVLAHEFGHFAQRTMAVGRWVYVAHQIAAQLIARRDKLDDFLAALSRFDVRVAWVGWILGVIVWSIRSLIDTAFRGVLLLQRALSREMEMNADLVAVSMTGSDALIHALHKLQAADDLWGRALAFGGSEKAKGRYTRDLFAIQSELLSRMGRLYNDPHFGQVPPGDAAQPAAERRLFTAALAQPPRMWLTHPLNHEREANAKRRYIAADTDPRSAWELFAQPEQLREKLSAELLEKPADQPTAEPADSLRELDRHFATESLDGRYRGAYYGRSAVRWADRTEKLFTALPPDADLRAQLDALYPESLAATIEKLTAVTQELGQLRALQSGVLQADGQRIQHRGRTLTRGQLPQAIQEVEQELARINQELQQHDQLCRSTHRAAAEQLGAGWAEHLQALVHLLHYADHAEANLRDLQSVVATSVQTVTATRRVSEDGLQRVLNDASYLRQALQSIYDEAPNLQLDAAMLADLGAASWAEALGEFKLPMADRANVGQWLDAAGSWVDHAARSCARLGSLALDHLLRAERRVAQALRDGEALPDAPPACTPPLRYATLAPGQERPRLTKLGWWARFQIADGWLPAGARLLVAGGVVVGVLGFSASVGETDVMIYNGLGRPVDVSIAGTSSVRVPAHGHVSKGIAGKDKVVIEARTTDGVLIEHFDAELRGRFGNRVYNIAAAAPLVEWTAVYGNVRETAPRELGAQRWLSTHADVLFTEPPTSISTKGGGGSRTVLTGLGEASPASQLARLTDAAQRRQLIAAHARWDAPEWISLIEDPGARQALLAERLRETPDSVMLGRLDQEMAGDQRAAVCARYQAAADAHPESADRLYLALRCDDDAPGREAAIFQARQRFPNSGWIAFLAGYHHAELGQWSTAQDDYQVTLKTVPEMADEVGVTLGRLQRVTDRQGAVNLQTLMDRSRGLKQLMALELGSAPNGTIEAAYQQLGRGELDAALNSAQPDAGQAARLLRLAAGSDGAPPRLVQRALALPDTQGLDSATLWPSLGLALRQGKPIEPLMVALQQLRPRDRDGVLRFMTALRQGATVTQLDALRQGLPLELQAGCSVTGLVVLGSRAPATWRHLARRALFTFERPYFTAPPRNPA